MTINLSEARALYDAGAPVTHVAGLLGLSDKAFRRFRADNGWPLRPSPIRAKANPKAPSPAPVSHAAPQVAEGAAAPVSAEDEPDISRFRVKIQGRVHKQMAEIERRFGEPGADVERDARLLASLVKSLTELRRLEALCAPAREKTGDMDERDDERPPRDLATLREELARALSRIEGDAGAP